MRLMAQSNLLLSFCMRVWKASVLMHSRLVDIITIQDYIEYHFLIH